jgi:hypothetical protein
LPAREISAPHDAAARTATETQTVNQIGPDCTLHLAGHGDAVQCTYERCAFWEPGGTVARSGCLVERLGVDVRRADLATYLLGVRERLEQARDLAEAGAAHRQLARRIGIEF